jgi:ATP-dependent helicase/DNAse subunit B
MASARKRSASSLGDFAQCAYRHFASRGLNLRERDPAAADGLSSLTAGSGVHAALENAFRDGAADPMVAAQAFDAAWAQAAGHLRPTLALARDRARMLAAVTALAEREAHAPLVPGYRPTHAELAFGDSATRVAVAGTPGVELRGRIDRIEQDGAGRALVIDWKWQSFDKFSGLAARIAEGRDLQLPLYVLAAQQLLGRRVVAAGLVALRDKDFRARWLRLDESAPGRPPAKPGAATGDLTWTGDARDDELAAVERRVAFLDGQIRAGGIEARPTDPDRCGPGRCPFADLCRYEESAL